MSKLRKVLTNPIVGQRPNAPLETWNRLKKATADIRGKTGENTVLEQENPLNLVENGPNGEILLWCASSKVCQVWDWGHVESQVEIPSNERPNTQAPYEPSVFTVPSSSFLEEYTGDSLNMVSSFSTGPGHVLAMAVFPCSFANLLVFLQQLSSGERVLKVYHGKEFQVFSLIEPLTEGKLHMKVSQEYLIVSSSKGYLNIIKGGDAKIYIQNLNGEPFLALDHCTRPVVVHDGLDEAKVWGAFVKTSVAGSLPIYDIVGSWLVYSPTPVECNYFKKLQQSKLNVPKRARSNGYTPMKLPSNGPLLARVLSALSSSAADTLVSLSDFSTRAVKKSKDLIEKDISLKSVSSSIGNSIYSTASAVYSNSSKLVKTGAEAHVIKILDLSSGNTIALFKAPGGVSHLSLNEYDLHLAQANARGDTIYLWDLYKLPKEVSLVGSFQRGKTSARIREMIWFMSNTSEPNEGTIVSNFGLGCITERSGSIHWFHINYLFSGKDGENYPNISQSNGRKSKSHGHHNMQNITSLHTQKSDQFLNIWTLPSLGAEKFMKLPSYANVSDDVKRSDFKNPYIRDEFSRLNQLAYVDGDMNLRLISTINGKHNFKYVLPKVVREENDGRHDGKNNGRYERWHDGRYGPLSYRNETQKLQYPENPISQAEIETCEPYVPFIQNQNCNIAVYDFGDSEGEEDGVNENTKFWDHFAVFGGDIGHVIRDFHSVSHGPLVPKVQG